MVGDVGSLLRKQRLIPRKKLGVSLAPLVWGGGVGRNACLGLGDVVSLSWSERLAGLVAGVRGAVWLCAERRLVNINVEPGRLPKKEGC